VEGEKIQFNYALELFNNSSTGQFIINGKGTVLKINSSFTTMLDKKDAEELLKKNFLDFIIEDDRDIVSNALEDFKNNLKNSETVNIRYRSSKGVFWGKFHFDRVKAGNSYLILGVVIDINSEMEFQDSLLEAKQAAEKSEASKSIFLANMSHEIRTPIHTVTGLTELLSDTNLDSEQTEYVTQIGFAAKVLLTLINDILDFSKIEAGKLVFENIEYNLYETILNSVDLSALEAHRKGVDVAISIDDDMPKTIVGDQVRLRQVIVNLMSNAVKFTHSGEIILTVNTVNKSDESAVLRFAVADSGIGISHEKQKRLFKAFSQADTSTTRQFGGTGLGLSISSSLVQMMGGDMKVESKEGKGATFYFEIPVTMGREKNLPPVPPPRENLKALVVDDNIKVNKIFSDLLRAWNYNVVEVYTVKDALSELIIKATTGDPYDLCFIDQILPGMDGWQLASEINSNSLIKTTKTLLMSLKGKGIEESKMKLLGWFQGYLTKPVSREELFKAIEELYSRTLDMDMVNSKPDDEIEELETLVDEEDDDDFMEPLTFSDHVYEQLEELYPIEDGNPRSVFGKQQERDIITTVTPTPKVEVKKEKILVVEDHLVNQKLFKIILEKSGFDVSVASDGKEAVEKVKDGDFDLVFMDCQMPVMNGYDSSKEIRRLGYVFPIVAVTASAVKGEYEKCIRAGMSDIMTKPFKKEDVMASIDKWLHSDSGSNMLFEYDKALERFMGEKDILLEVLQPYIENLDNNLLELKSLNSVNDCVRIREVAHSIKGSSLNLDICGLGRAAEALEDAAYNKICKEIPELVSGISY